MRYKSPDKSLNPSRLPNPSHLLGYKGLSLETSEEQAFTSVFSLWLCTLNSSSYAISNRRNMRKEKCLVICHSLLLPSSVNDEKPFFKVPAEEVGMQTTDAKKRHTSSPVEIGRGETLGRSRIRLVRQVLCCKLKLSKSCLSGFFFRSTCLKGRMLLSSRHREGTPLTWEHIIRSRERAGRSP